MLLMCHFMFPGNSKRHPLNSADGSVVRNTKRYTLKRRVATATTLITIRGIPRHGKLQISDSRLLAQFGLTPKSRRGLSAGEAGDALASVRPIRPLPRVREQRGLADMRLTGGVQEPHGLALSEASA
jgi:hypothetical protein